MIYQERRFVMKNGETAVIRSPYPSEAGKMLEYIRMMSAETEFVGRYPEEIRETLEEETDFLKRCCDSADSVQISAFVNGRLAGNASVEPVSNRKKMHHRADFGIAILKEFWGLGLGGELTFACLDLAELLGFVLIELGMLVDNE